MLKIAAVLSPDGSGGCGGGGDDDDDDGLGTDGEARSTGERRTAVVSTAGRASEEARSALPRNAGEPARACTSLLPSARRRGRVVSAHTARRIATRAT